MKFNKLIISTVIATTGLIANTQVFAVNEVKPEITKNSNGNLVVKNGTFEKTLDGKYIEIRNSNGKVIAQMPALVAMKDKSTVAKVTTTVISNQELNQKQIGEEFNVKPKNSKKKPKKNDINALIKDTTDLVQVSLSEGEFIPLVFGGLGLAANYWIVGFVTIIPIVGSLVYAASFPYLFAYGLAYGGKNFSNNKKVNKAAKKLASSIKNFYPEFLGFFTNSL